MGIKYLDMFSGIGGFRSAFDRVGGFECVGFCEIDEKAKETYEAIYDTKGELYFNDAREINPNALPDIDLICGGFPCQSFSIAGKRGGFEDTRLDQLRIPGVPPAKRLDGAQKRPAEGLLPADLRRVRESGAMRDTEYHGKEESDEGLFLWGRQCPRRCNILQG